MTTYPAGANEPIARAEPLREAVYLRIVALISAGKYAPGAPLTEAGLSRTLQVSRTPVREALLRLQAEGVLQSALARGFTVRPLVRRDAAELYPVLASLEALATRTITALDPATTQRLRTVLDELEGCADPVRRWQLDTEWHTAIAAAAGNRHLLGMLTQLRTNLSRYELAYMREVKHRADVDHEHRKALAALAAGDFAHAADLLEAHWHDGMRTILDWLDGPD
ncbi:GntR family transcriptional regulator [Streptomyces sp. CMB-StM0423]|uniref:GntR family transcriptional regulator n=1 Tax=Streptomyces sp. CMB-StM0423 TaxID=2059884 RepID=UPI000C6FD354|nr:GntR family transcriptional regulator [Streptomyces sp. CMB-StM0423]AUH41696.1 GntR family transcriptional regulator [Streptomyces sp. CMB-StM0423]